MKFIVVTGGVISGLGKGITASSIGLLLKSTGLNVTAIKIDPYLNIDAGTMSPYEHGECYVLADSGETDLDIGNYERFLDIELEKDNNITTGKIYQSVISKERNGDYLGKTVQLVPHVTDEIQLWIKKVSSKLINGHVPDVCIIEVGGTVGDMEVWPFLEAIRQLHYNDDTCGFCFVHVSLIINNGELKTKPTQDSVAKLRSLGIFPDLLVLRTENMLPEDVINKLKILCQVNTKNIISNTNVKNIYYVPDLFKKQNICEQIALKLNIELQDYDLTNYYKILNHFENNNKLTKTVGIAGKYTGSPDTYLSLIRAIEHASFSVGINADIKFIDTEHFDETMLKECDCLIIPGGFGSRGIKGKMKVAKYARDNNIPILGICLGLQIMVVDFWNSMQDYNKDERGDSTEWNPDVKHNIIDILPNQTGIKGGTMRLGNYTTLLDTNTKIYKLYGSDVIEERHRHRYEVNNSYVEQIQNMGLVFSGKSNNTLIETIELPEHKYYLACQYHPEYKSRYNKPHPLFEGLLNATIN